MRPKIRCGTLILIVIACATGLALGPDLVRSGANAEARGATLPVGAQAPASSILRDHRPMQPLSDEERAEVLDHVMRTPGVPVAEFDPPVAGAAIPASVELQDLPGGVAQIILRIAGYKFVKLDDRILLVHPRSSRTVVAEMPRNKLALQ